MSNPKTRTSTRTRGRPKKGAGPDWDGFLEAFAHKPVILYACRAAGVDRSTVRDRIDKHPTFARALELAREDGIDEVEIVAFDLARGMHVPSDPNAEPPDREMIKLVMRAWRADRYTPAVQVKGAATLAELRSMTDSELDTIARKLGLKPEAA